MATGFVYDPAFLDHHTGANHPECGARLQHTIRHLKALDWFNALTQLTPARPDPKWLEAVHDPDYIERARRTCASGGSFLDSLDVGISQRSFELALLAVGATFTLADQIAAHEIDNGFALIRPPGHHAERDQALGFCLFNNVAILARYLQRHHQLDKLVVLDWDVHHGNGTQHTFENDPAVLYISIHQYPFYPGTGAYGETGIGQGRGATLNCPVPAGAADADYRAIFQDQVLPKIDQHRPEAIILSSGFDAHADDPLGQVNLSTECYRWMTERIVEKAAQYSERRIISVLEGGYHLGMLPLCIEQHLAVLAAAHSPCASV